MSNRLPCLLRPAIPGSDLAKHNVLGNWLAIDGYIHPEAILPARTKFRRMSETAMLIGASIPAAIYGLATGDWRIIAAPAASASKRSAASNRVWVEYARES